VSQTDEWRELWVRYKSQEIIPVLLPGGTRTHRSIPEALKALRWIEFPPNINDSDTVRNLALVILEASRREPHAIERQPHNGSTTLGDTGPVCPRCQQGRINLSHRRCAGEIVGCTITCSHCDETWEVARLTRYPLHQQRCPKCKYKGRMVEVDEKDGKDFICLKCGNEMSGKYWDKA